jgi:hypothetical protein
VRRPGCTVRREPAKDVERIYIKVNRVPEFGRCINTNNLLSFSR